MASLIQLLPLRTGHLCRDTRMRLEVSIAVAMCLKRVLPFTYKNERL